MIPQDWWSLPGPNGFTAAVTKELISHGIVAVKCPRPFPGGMIEAIRRKLTDEYVVDTVMFNASTINASQSPLHEMAMLRGVSGTSIGTVTDFIGNPDLADTAFVVDGISPDRIQSWSYLLRAIRSERLKSPITAGPYIIILPPKGMTAEVEKRLLGQMKAKIWRGYLSSMDSIGWLAANGVRIGAGIDERLAIATSVEVAAWSVSLLDQMTRLDLADQISPMGSLEVLAGQKEWAYPCWENGLIDTWDDVPTPHALAAVAHGITSEVERRIWVAQCKVLLSIVDSARRGIIRTYLDELSKHASVSSPYVKTINDRLITISDPRDFEWYEIITLLSNVVPYHRIQMMKSLKFVRDALSHGKTIPVGKIKNLSEMWEDQVLDLMTAPVSGWDWPRVGQKLIMTVGPSGAGKSTWASLQTARIVSSDAIREELFGSAGGSNQGEVFRTARRRIVAQLRSGEDVILDATNIKTQDRKLNATSVPVDLCVEYVLIDRPLDDKKQTGGSRSERLIEEHDRTFRESLAECLEGDGLSNVHLIDLRQRSLDEQMR